MRSVAHWPIYKQHALSLSLSFDFNAVASRVIPLDNDCNEPKISSALPAISASYERQLARV